MVRNTAQAFGAFGMGLDLYNEAYNQPTPEEQGEHRQERQGWEATWQQGATQRAGSSPLPGETSTMHDAPQASTSQAGMPSSSRPDKGKGPAQHRDSHQGQSVEGTSAQHALEQGQDVGTEREKLQFQYDSFDLNIRKLKDYAYSTTEVEKDVINGKWLNIISFRERIKTSVDTLYAKKYENKNLGPDEELKALQALRNIANDYCNDLSTAKTIAKKFDTLDQAWEAREAKRTLAESWQPQQDWPVASSSQVTLDRPIIDHTKLTSEHIYEIGEMVTAFAQPSFTHALSLDGQTYYEKLLRRLDYVIGHHPGSSYRKPLNIEWLPGTKPPKGCVKSG